MKELNINRVFVDNQSKYYYELVNLNTNDTIVGNNMDTFSFGLICTFRKSTAKIKERGG
jgi:hypothetical protein